MSDNTEGAGPALAAHSKDASTPGHNPASEATGEARPPEGGEALQDLLDQAVAFMRVQPLVSVAVCIERSDRRKTTEPSIDLQRPLPFSAAWLRSPR
jgi:hypothetical protein